MNKNNKRILAVSLLLVGLSLIFLINGLLYAPPQEPPISETAGDIVGPKFAVPEIPGTVIPLILGVTALLILYIKK
ncbi:MAG: hypothetical protein ACUVV4_09005 [Candidatus Bathyarchaeia archaeon]